MNVDGSGVRRLSSGEGRTTCGYFYPAGTERALREHASRRRGLPAAPVVRARLRLAGLRQLRHLPQRARRLERSRASPRRPGYDAEATIGPDGRIVFTSVRDGDMEIYSMNGDGSDVRRLTNRPGPDGGPFFSRDGRQIVFRGRPIEPGAELDDYRALLKQGLWRPTSLEIFVMNRDGSNLRQVTKQRRRELRALLHARRRAHHLRVEPAQPARPRLRSVPDRRRRHRPRARHPQRHVRRLPDVLAGWVEAGVRVESARQDRPATPTSSSPTGLTRRRADAHRGAAGAGVTPGRKADRFARCRGVWQREAARLGSLPPRAAAADGGAGRPRNAAAASCSETVHPGETWPHDVHSSATRSRS